jgi:thiaminase
MSFFNQLQQQTAVEQQLFLDRKIIKQTLAGEVSLARYHAFLTQAYHHVKHTVPLLMACGSRLPSHYYWLQKPVAEYIDEEIGHEQWILSDLKNSGADANAIEKSTANQYTQMMLAYAYHQIDRQNPLAFFAMVHVLEGTSTSLATAIAGLVQKELDLPTKAFSYLLSHGDLDIEHVKYFEVLINKIENPQDQQDIINATKVFYHLYGEVLDSVAV